MVRILGFHCCGLGFNLWSGNRSQKMLSAAKRKKKFLIKITEMKGKENFRSSMRKAVSKIQRNLHRESAEFSATIL